MSDSGQEALTEIRAHERECVLRYKAIENSLERGSKRFDKIEHMLWGIYIALFCIVLHCITLHYIALNYIALDCIALHCI